MRRTPNQTQMDSVMFIIGTVALCCALGMLLGLGIVCMVYYLKDYS